MLQFELLGSYCDISHFITTRRLSSSLQESDQRENPYAGFNVCDYSGDSIAHIQACRKQLAEVINIPVDNFIFPRQVHGDTVLIIEESGFPGEADALITNRPHLCLSISTADCVPVLLYCPEKNVIAAIHAGWRGTVKRIVSKTVRTMQEKFGCSPAALIAGIGPSISCESFEVGREVADAFQEAGYTGVIYPALKPEKANIDLWTANKQDLTDAGLSEDHIEISGICTFKNYHEFFSARRLGIGSGRIASGIMLRSEKPKRP